MLDHGSNLRCALCYDSACRDERQPCENVVMKGGHKAVQGFAEAHPPHGHGLLQSCRRARSPENRSGLPYPSCAQPITGLKRTARAMANFSTALCAVSLCGLLVREKHMRLRRAYWKGKGAAD